MLDKVGGKIFPAVKKDTTTTNDDVISIVAPGSAVEPVKKPTIWRTVILGLIQTILMLAILFGSYMAAKQMIDDKPQPAKRRAFKTVYTVETVTATKSDYQPIFTSYGQTVAARSVDLRALVPGEIVKVSPKLRQGARVGRGDALVEIDRFNYQGALAEAQANLVEAQAKITENKAQISLEIGKRDSALEQLDLVVADLSRVESLKQRQTATQQQVEVRKLVVSQRKQAVALAENTIKVQQARVEQLKASLLRLQWRVDQAKRNLESTILFAPFSGIVRSSTAEIGRAITTSDVVVSMYEADTMEVKFTLTDAQYGRLQTDEQGLIGRKLDVVWSAGGKDWKYPATIDRIGADITSSRGGVELFALVGQASDSIAIRPGAFVEVRVPDSLFSNVIIVPDTAVYGTDTVYTAVNGKLVENKVDIVAFEGETALIGSGLNNGDEVLLTRITEVSAGLNVQRAQEVPKRAAGQQGNSSDGRITGAGRGRPSAEEISRIAKANGLSIQDFEALSGEDRRQLIRAHRASGQ